MGLTGFGRVVVEIASYRDCGTQRKIAEELGFTKDQVHNYLNGNTEVPPPFVRAILDAWCLAPQEREALAEAFAFSQEREAKAEILLEGEGVA